MSANTTKLFVGYTTKLVDDYEELMPEFEPRKGTIDPEKTAAQVEEKRQKFIEEAAHMPYTATFDEVVLLEGRKKGGRQASFSSRDRPIGGERLPVSAAVWAWLNKHYQGSWPWDTHAHYKPKTVFMGFNPRLFLKILGLELSLPLVDRPAPPTLWFANMDHRDIQEAVLPKTECKHLTMDSVIKARRKGLGGSELDDYDRVFGDWDGPGKNARKDALASLIWAAQLGFTIEDHGL